MKHRILVVEDEPAVARGVHDALSFNGYTVDLAEDGSSGYLKARDGAFDLIVLDVMLPGMSGLDVLARLRNEGIGSTVLLLTARSQEADRVRGLDLGADDYVVKPFSLAELRARIRSRLRAWDRERGLDAVAVVIRRSEDGSGGTCSGGRWALCASA